MATHAGNGRNASRRSAKFRAWGSFAKTCGAAELKSLAPALLFLLVFASAGLLHTHDPSPPSQDDSTPAESVAPSSTPVATSFHISGSVQDGVASLSRVTA